MKKLVYFLMIIILFIITMMGGGCTKREVLPEQIIFWENSSNDTIDILIDGINAGVGLYPHQSRIKGDASWLNRTYTLPGTADHIQITMRNTITGKGY